jgi:hypothetical protein
MIMIDKNHPALVDRWQGEATLTEAYSRLQKAEREYSQAVERGNQKAMQLDQEVEAFLHNEPIKPTQIDNPDDLHHAVRVARLGVEKQEVDVRKLRNRFSRVVCEKNRPQYVQIETKMIAAVRELAEVNRMERDFFRSLRDVGVTNFCFQSMAVEAIGYADDPNSGAALFARRMKQLLPEIA